MRSWRSGSLTGRPSPGTSRERGGADAMTGLDDPDLVLRFWKPYDCLTAFTDRDGRQTLADHIDVPNVYPAGRLDRDSEGLLLLPATRRSGAPHRCHDRSPSHLSRARGGDPVRRRASSSRHRRRSQGRPPRSATAEFLATEPALPPRPVPIRIRKSVPDSWIRLTLTEGKNRQVRRMTAAVGHPTLRLVRIAIGSITLEGLEPGQWDAITPEEKRDLRDGLTGLRRAANRSGAGRRPPGRRSRR